MPTFAKSYTAVSATTLTAANFNSNWDALVTFLNTTGLDSSNIQALSITNALISASAAIATSKLATTTAGYVLLGATTTGIPTFAAMSGDVTITGAGVTAIGASKVTNAMLAGSITEAKITAGTLTTASLSATAGITSGQLAGSIAVSKLASGTANQVLINSAVPTPAWTTVSGDLTNVLGVFSVGDNKITSRKMSATRGTVVLASDTALTGVSTDLTGMDTGSITPAVNCTIDIMWGIAATSASAATDVVAILTQSTGGGAYSAITNAETVCTLSNTFGYNQASAVTSVALTGGTSYQFRMQASKSGAATVNARGRHSTYMHWKIVA